MRNLLTLLLVCCCLSPAFAQGNFWRGLTHWTRPAAFETNIKSAVLRTEAALKLPVTPHIRITNLPGEPLVKLGGAADNAPAVLSARMLSGAEYRHLTNADNDDWSTPLYLPLTLNTEERSFYRGFNLNNLQAVKNILENGIEIDKVSEKTEEKIYFSGYARRAMQFSVRGDGDEYNLLPTMVRFNVPTWTNVYIHKLLCGLKDYIVHNNIRVGNIRDVMVFLEVNGKPGWYKVTLENGELIFTPAPSRVFEEKELIIHEF